MADVLGRDGWRETRVDAACRLREDFRQGDLLARHIVRVQLVEVRADEATIQGGGDIVRVTLDHEAEVEEAGLRQVELADDVPKQDAGHDGGTGRSQTPAEWDWVVYVDVRLWRKGTLVVAPENVQGRPGQEVVGRVEVNVLRSHAGVGHCAVQWIVGSIGRRGFVDTDAKFEVH